MVRFLPLVLGVVVLAGVVSFRGEIVTVIKKEQFKNAPEVTELLSNAFVDKILAADGKWQENQSRAVWFNDEILSPGFELAARIRENPRTVLGESTDNKWIEVDLSKQRLYAHEGDRIVFDMPVSTGLPWLPTVTGDFRVWAKVRAQRMNGGSRENGTYYDLPNVPFVQYFYGGYGLHGTYWHNDFGRPRSHGCVNLSIPNAEKLFYWTDPAMPVGTYALYKIAPATATRVVVHGKTPTNIY